MALTEPPAVSWGSHRARSKASSKTLTVSGRLRKTSLKVGTWNVRTLLYGGNLENIKHEMSRLQINILGLWMGEKTAVISELFIPEVKHINEAWQL